MNNSSSISTAANLCSYTYHKSLFEVVSSYQGEQDVLHFMNLSYRSSSYVYTGSKLYHVYELG